MSTSKIIAEFNNISKSFKNEEILNDISFIIKEGEIFGLLGPSGAGKTTILKILIGFLKPNKGSVFVFEKNINNNKSLFYERLGVLLDKDGLFERLTCYDNLVAFASFYRINNKKKHVEDLLKKVDLYDDRNKSINKLSHGMRQRLAFARAIINQPSFLILDEPTSGLDPTTTLKIHEIISDLKKNGTTIFITTHNMHEAQLLCDNLILLNKGKIVEQGNPKDICLKYKKDQNIYIESKDGIKKLSFDEFKENIQKINEDDIISIHSNEPNLEDVFLKLTGDKIE